jgi:hypothetical protein
MFGLVFMATIGYTLDYKNLQCSDIINKKTIKEVIIPQTREVLEKSEVKYSLTGLLESLSTQDIVM